MKSNFIFFLCISCGQALFAQESHKISGYVYERLASGSLAPLHGAHVFCLKDQKGAVTDGNGAFFISTHYEFPHSISASFVGYKSDTINLFKAQSLEFILEPDTLEEIRLYDRQKSTAKSLVKIENVEWVSRAELEKAACCNLSECFETSASVDVGFTDAITGAKQIQMLGLDGVYTQVLFENMPLLRGLSASYGLNYLPGSWIESIQIAKGTGSVVSGFESLSGQVNVEIYKPQSADKLFWNSYVNSSGLIENNFVLSAPLKSGWKTALLGHYSSRGKSIDMNGDGFADNPEMSRLTLLNRWEYTGFENRHILFGFRYLSEGRHSGQISGDDPQTEIFEIFNPYEVDLNTEQGEFHSKTGFIFEKKGTSLALISSLRYHNQETTFGNSFYSGAQYSIYFNAIYQTLIGSSDQILKAGLSYYGDNYKESLLLGGEEEGLYERLDQTFGAFSETQINVGEGFSSTLGLRLDRSWRWGLWWSPRIHMRYNPLETMVIRASAGKAHRQANILAENISYFFSSRLLDMQEDYADLEVEKAWNYGFNLAYTFQLLKKETTFNMDLYHTNFSDQVVVDVEQTQKIKIYNLEGSSSSLSLQVDLSIEPSEGWEIKFAQKWNETKLTYRNDLNTLNQESKTVLNAPFVSKHRSLVQVSYTSWQGLWDAHLALQNLGPSRVPSQGSEEALVEGFWSPNFNLLSGQATRKFPKFEWYIGVENALNYMQPNPIRGIQNPFSSDFDAAMIWGPVMGRIWYSGIKLRLNN
tara:strand:- start:13638 stop:15908 length:2271 start_codon:yes stop_codon:yes gene_type:complete